MNHVERATTMLQAAKKDYDGHATSAAWFTLATAAVEALLAVACELSAVAYAANESGSRK